MNKVKTVVMIPDLQVPFHDKKALNLVLKYIKDTKVDEVIILGDFMDIFSLSSHADGRPGQLENHRIFDEYKQGNKVLDKIQKASKNCKLTYLEGNHEFRVERYYDKFPVLRGQLDVDKCLNFKERGIKYVKCYTNGDVYQLGNAYFHHGLYINDHHAKKHVSNFGVNIFYGHTHDFQSYSKVLWGEDKTIVGQSLGCLCDYKQSYVKGNPTSWQLGFGVFYIRPSGFFTYYTPRIFDYKFVAPNGKIYA
ncbi:MAG: hypothetical protein U9O94_04230 [Nanoarchaeota archaeon]|nr:hypothetical protein [Nanoarchaeota archaeon]